jgi:osmotically inducible lipoprotein OsmB
MLSLSAQRNFKAKSSFTRPDAIPREIDMRSITIVLLAAAFLSGCGTTTGDRGLSGAGIGAGIGVIGGPPGMVLGGAIGAGVGMVTKPSTVNLGKPAWKG